MEDMKMLRMKAKSKYLDDLLQDNDGKMAIEIKKAYSPAEGMKTKGIEIESDGEENGEMENEGEDMGMDPTIKQAMQGAMDVAEDIQAKSLLGKTPVMKKTVVKKTMGTTTPEEGTISAEDISKLLKALELGKL